MPFLIAIIYLSFISVVIVRITCNKSLEALCCLVVGFYRSCFYVYFDYKYYYGSTCNRRCRLVMRYSIYQSYIFALYISLFLYYSW